MFEKLGMFASLMKNLPRISEETEKLRQRLAEVSAEGDAGAGMVKVRINGRMEVLGFTVSEEALKDREMLEDLLTAATNQALGRIRQQVGEETAKMATSLGLPPGMGLPGGLPGLS